MKRVLIGAAIAAPWNAPSMAADLKILSAGAVEPGLHKAVALFKQKTGHDVAIQFNTAPQIARRMQDGYVADVLIAPPGALDNYAKAGMVSADGRAIVGKVGAGVVVRPDAPAPDIKTVDLFKRAVLAADSLVYNTASTGIYLETLFDRLGIGAELKPKTTRHPNGDAVMQHVIKGKGKEIGFGAITEIKMFEAKGQLKLVGPLPAEVQNYTSYAAAQLAKAPARDAAKAFLAFLGTPEARTAFTEAGID